MTDRFDGKGAFVGALQPSVSHDELISAFVQDQIALSESVRLILGTKLGHNDFSGFEVQPSVRAAWEVSRSQTLWAAVSRAVRVPTRIERDLSIDASNPAANRIFRLLGNRDFEGEELLAYEVGHRSQVSSRVSLDFAGFHNRYQRLASLELGTAFIDPATGKTIVPVVNRNLTDGHATGAEMQATFSPSPYWQLSGTWSYVSLHLVPHGLDLSRRRLLAAATPRNQLGLRSSLDLPAGFELDAQLRHLTAIDSSPQITPGTRIPAYAELDVRLAWRATERVELSVVGQNLLHAHHAELGTVALGGEIERSVYGRVALRY
jgi:iron complex outermembrane receptor protein